MKDFICDTIIWISLIVFVVAGNTEYQIEEDRKCGRNRELQEAVKRQCRERDEKENKYGRH